MFNKFKTYIEQNHLCTHADKILVAVSGGADSVVLLHLLTKANYNVALAHCNFKLRGNESDNDELFVKQLCKTYDIPSHFITFDTTEYSHENKISIEMAARDLRYSWFEKLGTENGYSKIATGHHLNDSIETLLLNLARGTGINGLTGILAKNGQIIRPLLFATRTDIENFAQTENLEYRHDSSNDSTEYLRNIIRHKIIPTFTEINPAFEQVMSRNISNFSDAAKIYKQSVNDILVNIVEKQVNCIKLNINKLQKSEHPQTLLFETLSPLGFSFAALVEITKCLTKEPGRMFYSETHQLVIDREYIFIEPIVIDNEFYCIDQLTDFQKLPISIGAQLLSGINYKIITSQNAANFDAETIQFPITVRHWQVGDRFFPLGMKQAKKLSDFFTDLKIDRLTKDKIWIMESCGEIIWIVGYRIDDRFKVTKKTKNVLLFKLQA